MDELMNRFVLNLHRNEHREIYEQSSKLLFRPHLRNESEEAIAASVTTSMKSLQTLMF